MDKLDIADYYHARVGKGQSVHLVHNTSGLAICGSGINTIGTRWSSRAYCKTDEPVNCKKCLKRLKTDFA